MIRAAMSAAVLVALLAGCTAPARTDGQFAAKASLTGTDTVSQLATLQLLAEAVGDDRMAAPSARVVSRDANEDLAAIRRAFAGVKPPTAASAVDKARWQALLDDAGRAAAFAEQAIDRGDAAALGVARARLGAVIDRIGALDEETAS